MTIASMTGYGQGETLGPAFQIVFEIRTFNSRFLDINVRAPKELPQLETLVRQAVREKLKRGRVEVAVHLHSSASAAARINRAAIGAYCDLAESVGRDFKVQGELTLDALLQLPGVLEPSPPMSAEEREAVEGQIRTGLEKALQAVLEMRHQEGLQLGADLVAHARNALSLVGEIEGFVEPAKAAYREKLMLKMQEYREMAQWDSERVAQEVVVFAERGDISEEIARLRSHLDQFLALIDAGGETGKKLDFLLQEMNREANTILSKSLHRKISEAGVVLKAEIERLREQVQNIE